LIQVRSSLVEQAHIWLSQGKPTFIRVVIDPRLVELRLTQVHFSWARPKLVLVR